MDISGRSPLNVRIDDSVAAEIQKGGTVISHGRKTSRLIFETPGKRSDINIAIAQDPQRISPLMMNRRWTKLTVKQGDGSDKTVFVNINSLCKRLSIEKIDVYKAIRDHTLESLVSSHVEKKMQELKSEKPQVAASVQPSSKSIGSLIERIKGALVDLWWSIATGSWDLFRFRFLLGATDEQLQQEGQLRALTAYHNAYDRVPAYKKFVTEKTGDAGPKSFDTVPLMGKKEYIQKVDRAEDTYVDGKIPRTGQIDSSTGTTGEPSIWMRSADEVAMTQKLMGYARKAKFGSDDVAIINTFALGLWATGITIAGSGPQQGLIANVGVVPDAIEKTITIMKKIVSASPGRAIVLCGYPPNIRKIAQAVQNDPELKKAVENGSLKLHGIVGGEGMTEDVRDDIIKKGFKSVLSSYGASDLDINIGNETDTEIQIRRACADNPALAMELYGGGPPPMVFRYDPMHYYIETTKDSELVFTCCNKERSSPRIRYNLHDTGKVMMCKDVRAILKKYGVEITPRTNLPFLFVHGREGTITYGAAKIHYEHLEEAIRDGIAEGVFKKEDVNMDRFVLFRRGENELEFWLEAASDAAYEQMKTEIDIIQNKLVQLVGKKNTDFKQILDSKVNPYPQLRLFKPKASPMSVHAELNPHRKLQRVILSDKEMEKTLQETAHAYAVSSCNY